jgi:uncharacterized protein YjlB
MIEVTQYFLPPTALMPNSPYPHLHYTGFTLAPLPSNAVQFHDLLHKNGWAIQWIYRYGSTQRSHYHSRVHECMAVLSGTATLRFGVADTSPDMDENTFGSAKEEGGIEIQAKAGDVFLLPAGTAHKTFNAKPEAEFSLLSPGDGHEITGDDARKALNNVELSGFTMIGAYPADGAEWDFLKGGEELEREKVWAVERPNLDPVLGNSERGLCGLWSEEKLESFRPCGAGWSIWCYETVDP